VKIGHPDLVAKIAGEIQGVGPITFARFMDLVLYDLEFGYYMRPDAASEGLGPQSSQGPMESRIGWSGDFYTSPDVHPVLARALARQIRQVDELLGRPDPFTLIEMGPGKGILARDFLADCGEGSDSFGRRLRYVLIERSPAMRAAQRTHLAAWQDRVRWVDGLEELGCGGLTGAVLSNELVDALPVHRVRVQGGRPKEILVDFRDGGFVERLGELTTPALSQYVERLGAMGLTWPEGYTTEVNLQALEWIKGVARVLGRGLVLTIDYGHTAEDLYGQDRPRGTLLCYHDQRLSEDPYSQVGLQDMTAHVDFTSLATAGEEAGLRVTGFTNQMSFLMGLGVERLIEELEPGSPEFQSVIHLLRPDGMGRTFKILVQHKGMNAPVLDGLRYKPFFGAALTPRQARGERHEARGGSPSAIPSP
jgi:SAM-dependent MidA family methyltransferase